MSQNTTKNVLISVALIAFIISSGAFTIYQLAKKQTNNSNNLQISSQSFSSSQINPQDRLSNTSDPSNQSTNYKELVVFFDPYVCGLSITGLVDKPDIIQKLEIIITNKEKNEITQKINPKIDALKNFKILADEKIITDGLYTLTALASLTNQKIESTQTTIEFKKDCSNLIQNSAPASLLVSSTSNQSTSSNISSQLEIKNQSSISNTPIVESTKSSQIATVQSEVQKQLVEAPIQAITSSSNFSSSSLTADNSNNANAVRTGGFDITAILTILMIIISTTLVAKFKTRQSDFNEIFGNK